MSVLRRLTIGTLAMGAVAVAGSTGAAHAVSQNVSENCSSHANTSIAIGLQVGDTLTISTDALGDCDRVGTFTGSGASPQGVGAATAGPTGTESVVPYNAGTTSLNFGDRIIYSATAAGSIRILLEDWIFGDPTYYDITVTASTSNGSIESTHLSGVALGDVLQQVGVPMDGCASVMDATLNWAGVPSGGWSESWAPWANAGLGGRVCTRTLTHASTGWRVSS